MTRVERRAAERALAKEVQRTERHLELVDAGREVVFGGGWPSWSPMVIVQGPGSTFCRQIGCDSAFSNSRYQVLVIFERSGSGWPPLVHLSIKVHDKRCVHDWRDMQRIKNEIVGVESEGIELYPAESRLMDESNQFHLYCTYPGMMLPFGQQERTTSTPEELVEEFKGMPEEHQPVQRAFEEHHGGEGCCPGGLIEWPDWAKEELEKLGVDV